MREERIQIRLTKENKIFLEKLAQSEDRSLSQLAGRMIDAHIDILNKLGKAFHGEYVRLIKAGSYEDLSKAFSCLRNTDESIDEQDRKSTRLNSSHQ